MLIMTMMVLFRLCVGRTVNIHRCAAVRDHCSADVNDHCLCGQLSPCHPLLDKLLAAQSDRFDDSYTDS